MAGRAQQTFKKRQKEQQRKEKQQMKFAKRQQRKLEEPHDPMSEVVDFEAHGVEAEGDEHETELEHETPSVDGPAHL